MNRAALADAFVDGRAVGELEPSGRAADEITATWAWIHDQYRAGPTTARENPGGGRRPRAARRS